MWGVSLEHILGVGVVISSSWAAIATLAFFHSKAQREKEDKRIERKFEESVRRARAGLPVIPIEEIYEKQ